MLALLVLAAGEAHGGVRVYDVDPAQSRVMIQVDRSGLFGFAGHAHEVVAPSLTGEADFDSAEVARSSVALSFRAAALVVTGRGEPQKDVPKVQGVMTGPRVLDTERFPTITFRSDSVTGHSAGAGAWDLAVSGDFTLHGVTKRLTLPMRMRVYGDTLTVVGTAVLRQSDFGMQPVTVAGVVKVKDEITISYRIAGRVRRRRRPDALRRGAAEAGIAGRAPCARAPSPRPRR